MQWFLSLSLGSASLILWGVVWFFLEKTGLLPFYTLFPLFVGCVALDLLWLPRRSAFYYRKGLLRYALLRLQWSLFWTFSKKRRLTTLGEITWILMDLGYVREAGLFLSGPGDVTESAPPLFNASLARYLLLVDTPPHLPLLISEAALSGGGNARVWLCRGMALLQCDQPKSALRSLETSRTEAMERGDYILNGTCYYYLGLAWKSLGRVHYAKDQLLKAEVLLSPLPLGVQAGEQL